ncbi:MAG: type VI secretion system lipoprotein TssJ [Steroidobacteraceae bacterium]
MSVYRWCGALVACVALLAGACATKPPKPAPTRAVIAASADVNPDSTGRASPVVVRIYQLRGDAEFNGADFFALYGMERATLGSSLILRDERTLFPGQRVQIELALSPDARFLGVAAAYRDIRASRWRALVGVPEKSLLKLLAKRRVMVSVGKDAVSIRVVD